jgi:tetratricopeptide (TPR) repeat protein
MPPFDRDSALKAAEKALRLGKIDTAIAEYKRLVEAQPRDWNSANALGDLYVRAKQVDHGIALYTRIAEHLAREGFFPKAAALYKKILKIRPTDENALLQSGDLAVKQGLLADAKNAYKLVAERRRTRGDRKGAAEVDIRLGKLDPEDLDARLRSAHASREVDDNASAIKEFKDVALKLHKQGKPAEALGVFQLAYDLDANDTEVRRRLLIGYLEAGQIERARSVAVGAAELKQIVAALEQAGQAKKALEVLSEVAALDPDDLQVRVSLAQNYVASGDIQRAREFLDAKTAGDSAPLWLTLAEIELSGERLDEGGAAVVKALSLDSSVRDAAVAMGCRLAERSADAGYRCVDAVANRAVGEQDFAGAAAAIQEFVRRVPHHLIGLMRLVEVCVDGGLDATMYEAQAQLADAYLEVGRGLEARIISEDLVAREPWNSANIDRFKRALLQLGEEDPDGVIAERLSGESPFLATDNLDLNEGVFFEEAEGGQQGGSAEFGDSAESVDTKTGSPAQSADSANEGKGKGKGARGAKAAPSSLDQVFSEIRNEAATESDEEAAAELLGLATTYQDLGMVDDAIEALKGAVRSPRQCFQAARLLGRLYREKSQMSAAIEWLERAAEAPPNTPDDGRALLYDLADTLEAAGEHSRALAVFVELEADAGGFRDVTRRIERLSTIQTKG